MQILNRFLVVFILFTLEHIVMAYEKPKISDYSFIIGKGAHTDDSRYKDSIASIDNVLYGIKESDVFSRILLEYDSAEIKITKATVKYGNITHEARVYDNSITDTCRLADAGTYDKISTDITIEYYNSLSEQPVNDVVSLEIPQSIIIFDEPNLPTLPYTDSVKVSELDSLRFGYTATASGANDKGWNYTWLENTKKIGSGTKFESFIKHSVSGEEMKIDDCKYSVVCNNYAPDSTTLLFTDTIAFYSASFYNSPKPASHIECLFNEGKKEYIASGLGMTDEELYNRKYLFVFSGREPQTSRYLTNAEYAPIDVKTLWKYEDLDCYSESTPYLATDPNEPSVICAKAIFDKGNLVDDERYKGAVVSSDSVTHAFVGSELTYSIEIDTKGGELLSGTISFGEAKQETWLEGNKLITNSIFEGKAGKYQSITLEAEISMPIENGQTKNIKVTLQVPKKYTFALYDVPEMPKFEDAKLQSSELNSYTLSYTAKAKGANITGWNYEWLENTDSLIATGSKISREIRHEVDGDEMKADLYNYSVRCYNIAPDQKTIWFCDTIFVTTGQFYNSPKPAKEIVGIRNNDNNVMYIATGFSETDMELSHKKYYFVFSDEEPQTTRYLVNPEYAPKDVKTLWKYDGFDCYSEATRYDQSEMTEPTISSVKLNIDKGTNAKETRYKGAVQTADGRMHALIGSDINYAIAIDTYGGKIISGTMSYGTDVVEAEVYGDTIYTTYSALEKTGKVDNIKIDAVIRFNIENDQTKDIKMAFQLPKNKTFVIYPAPTYPKQVSGYKNQFAYSEERTDHENMMDIKMSVVPGENGNNNWVYQWSTETAGIVSNDTILQDKVYCKTSVGGNVKKTDTDIIRLDYFDISPNGEPWIEGHIDYPVKIYNAPSAPKSLIKKGDGSAPYFIIALMNEQTFDKDNVDAQLKERDYFFVYGNADSTIVVKDAQDPHMSSRWCDYSKYDRNDPWVQTLWKYPSEGDYPAFDCYSYRCYQNGVRATTEIDEIDSDEQLIGIYTLNGYKLPSNDIMHLDEGIYVIVKKDGDIISRTKYIVR